MKTEIVKVKGDWQDVVDDCRATVGKESLGKEPSEKFKREILISEHSPIRNISIKWKWRNIKSWVATHWSRHKWECYIQTQRTDRTGTNRDKLPQDAPVTFTGEANCQHLIDSWRKRLCFMASFDTRMIAEDFKTELHNVHPEIADVLVPNCVYRCGCPEPMGCEWFKYISEVRPNIKSTNIQERYDAYNDWFMGRERD